MGSKYCPACNRINSVAIIQPFFCMWCGSDLRNMPILPVYKEWGCDANTYQKILKEQSEKSVAEIQLKLF